MFDHSLAVLFFLFLFMVAFIIRSICTQLSEFLSTFRSPSPQILLASSSCILIHCSPLLLLSGPILVLPSFHLLLDPWAAGSQFSAVVPALVFRGSGWWAPLGHPFRRCRESFVFRGGVLRILRAGAVAPRGA